MAIKKGSYRQTYTFQEMAENQHFKEDSHLSKKAKEDRLASKSSLSDFTDEFLDQSQSAASLPNTKTVEGVNPGTALINELLIPDKKKSENLDLKKNSVEKNTSQRKASSSFSKEIVNGSNIPTEANVTSDELATLENGNLPDNLDQDDTSTYPEEETDPSCSILDGVVPSDLATLKQRIEKIVLILSSFTKLRDPSISRKDYVSVLVKDLSLYYGYNEYLIAQHFFHMFSVQELIQFLEASDVPRPVTIRTNSLKIKRRKDLAKALINRGINVDPLAIGDEEDSTSSLSAIWSSLGLQVFEGASERNSTNGPPSLGATPEYLSGLYMLQAAASFLPVVSLAPGPGDRVLDICAAPGGKSTHCAQLMKNSGLIVSNDLSKDRQKATTANIYRLGVRNAIVSVMDGRLLPSRFGNNFFDKVLLDAPCSGTGVISKDPSVKVSKDESDFKTLTRTQKELILAAIDLASANNGVIVYSTCSVCVEENEQVVQYALEKRPNVKIVDTHLSFGRPGFTSYRDRRFNPMMRLTMRYYPHAHNLDGFYVARLIKTDSFPKTPETLDLLNSDNSK